MELRVHPTMIPKDYLISKVDGIFNAIYVQGDAVGDTLYMASMRRRYADRQRSCKAGMLWISGRR